MSLFGGSAKTVNNTTQPATSLRVQTAVAGKARPIGWGQYRSAGNIIWYNDFQAVAHNSNPSGGAGKGSGGGGGGKGSSGSISYTYQVAVIIALGEGPIAGVNQLWNNKSADSLADQGFTLFTGNYTQSVWGYLSSTHPDQALNYRGLAFAAAGPLQLGNSQEVPNYTWETVYAIGNAIPGLPDADPAQVVIDYLTNPHYGLQFPPSNLDALSVYSNYCRATGMVVSYQMVDQRQASSLLNDLMTATNSEFVWSSGKLTVVPYGDSPLSANGATYTPPNQPLYSLGDNDFKQPQGTNPDSVGIASSQDPVQTVRKRAADQDNDIKIEYLDRSNSYNPTVVEAMDDGAVDSFGLRVRDTQQIHFFCSANAAQMAVQLQLNRTFVRNTFFFTVGQEYILLDPMDIIAITDAAQGLVNQWVRIKEITENSDNTLSIYAEEYLDGTGASPLFGAQAGGGYVPNYNVAPPTTNTPVVFAVPVALAQGSLQMGLIASGPAGWGGANVWISTDNATYKNIGQVLGPMRQGVLTSTLALNTDPDTTDTLAVDLTQSLGTLLSGTQADADNFNTLCYVDGEFISYETATLTSANKYNLTYLRRGAYGSPINQHLAGAAFARVDQSVFYIPYQPTQIGNTIYIKLTAFNYWGGGEEGLADVTAIPISLPAPPPPPNVADFRATQSGEVVSFSWSPVADNLITGYDIRFAPFGTLTWEQMIPLTEAAAGSEMTNAAVPNGQWTFAIRAVDLAFQWSPVMSTTSFNVLNTQTGISTVVQGPSWPGTLNGFVVHYSGVLVPDSQVAASADAGYAVFDNFVWQPVAQCTYQEPGFTSTKLALLEIGAAIQAYLGPGQDSSPVGGAGFRANPLLQIRYSQSGSSDPPMWTSDPTLMWNADPTAFMWSGISGYMPWTRGSIQTDFVQEMLVVNTSDGVPVIQQFTTQINQPLLTDGANGVTVSAGGTRITFANLNFINPPFVVASAVSGTGLTAEPSAIDGMGFTCHVYNSAGTDVGGTINWSAHT